jgi:hypothetical protein
MENVGSSPQTGLLLQPVAGLPEASGGHFEKGGLGPIQPP